tara:strand:+ start:541 stop:750 length:210 start_codon:yes stop_codon:yes gene_type:complete
MPWNPESYSVKTREVMKILEDSKITNVVKKRKLLPLKGHYIPGVTEKMTPSEEMQDRLEPIEDYSESHK